MRLKQSADNFESVPNKIKLNLKLNLGFIVVFLMISTLYSFGQKNCDCSRYRIGKFEVDNGDGTTSVFTRTKKYQSETTDNIKLKDRVEWIDECTFKLHPIKIKDDTKIIGNDVLIFKFIETFEHGYIAMVRIENVVDFEAEVKVYEYGYLYYDK